MKNELAKKADGGAFLTHEEEGDEFIMAISRGRKRNGDEEKKNNCKTYKHRQLTTPKTKQKQKQ